MPDVLIEPEEQVLSTLRKDGSRRWLKPKLSQGNYLRRRRIVAWILIAVFTLLPFIKLGGKPLVLLDIVSRRFTILGFTFLPTDTVLLALFLVGLLMSIFLVTALFGRVWCGWACPQTVYMEFLFRPIERFFDGTTGRGGEAKKNRSLGWLLLRYLTYLVICFYLANTFLAYFVGVDSLWQWIRQSPLQHPVPFLVMAAVTGLMMFDFCFFREQLCIVACPYGRFQSVLLDQNSMIVSYDQQRGEPRGKAKSKSGDGLKLLGDCIDCKLCVKTCPTGIDIRQGLQMECINCTQCIDACNEVMKKIDRPPDLIRYSSQLADSGKPNLLVRARVIIYPLILTMISSLFLYALFSKQSFNVILLRDAGNPFSISDDGEVRNVLKLKLTNRSSKPMSFEMVELSPPDVRIEISETELKLDPQATATFHLVVYAPTKTFTSGRASLKLRVTNHQGDKRDVSTVIIGPRSALPSQKRDEKDNEIQASEKAEESDS